MIQFIILGLIITKELVVMLATAEMLMTKKSDSEYREFLKQGLENSLRHTSENCHIFSWCDQRYIWLLQIIYQELGIKK